jgi:L-ribulokinase
VCAVLCQAQFIRRRPEWKQDYLPQATFVKRSRDAPEPMWLHFLFHWKTIAPGQTGLLRLTWDNGDRTVLVNPELGGLTLGWHLTHTAPDELFAAIEGTAFHTRVILERMEQHNVPIRRVINAGGIPQKNPVLNRVYANVLNKPVLVPQSDVTSLGSAIFAAFAAGAFRTIEGAQAALCSTYKVVEPDPEAARVYEELYGMYRELYFVFGKADAPAIPVGRILPTLRRIASVARGAA